MAFFDWLQQLLGGGDPEAQGAAAASTAMQPASSALGQGVYGAGQAITGDIGDQLDALWSNVKLPGQVLSGERDPTFRDVTSFALNALPVPGVLGKIKAYHASPADFERFDIGRAGSATDPGLMGKALYFSTDPAVAKAGPYRYEVNLEARNPLQVQHALDSTKSDVVGAALDMPPPAPGMLALGKNSQSLPEWQRWADSITEAAKARGHDATVFDYSPMGYGHQEIAVYDPSIIEILRKYGIIPPAVGVGLLGAADQQ